MKVNLFIRYIFIFSNFLWFLDLRNMRQEYIFDVHPRRSRTVNHKPQVLEKWTETREPRGNRTLTERSCKTQDRTRDLQLWLISFVAILFVYYMQMFLIHNHHQNHQVRKNLCKMCNGKGVSFMKRWSGFFFSWQKWNPSWPCDAVWFARTKVSHVVHCEMLLCSWL